MASLTIRFLNIFVSLVDILLFPAYFMIYKKIWKSKPRKLFQNHEFIFCSNNEQVLLKPSLPEPTCVNKEIIEKENLDTMAKLFDHSVAKFKDHPCLGTRKIIGTRKHFNENGKVLTKFLLEDEYHFNTYNDVSIRVTNVAKGLRYRSRAYPACYCNRVPKQSCHRYGYFPP